MKIGITYNLRDEILPESLLNEEVTEEFDTVHTIDALCDVFSKNGHEVVKLGGGRDVIDKLKKEKIDFVFNLAEGYSGRNRESHIPALLEMLSIPYYGSDPLALGLALDKIMTKRVASQLGIPVPRYAVAKRPEDINVIEDKLCYPVITKPAWEGSSKGIYNSSKVYDKAALEANIVGLLNKYPDQPVLVEEYIEGREITVGITGNSPPQILGIMEIINRKAPGDDFFYSLEVKRDWKDLVDYVVPAQLDRLTENHIKYYAITAFKEFGCRDAARMDFRISKYNRIFMLEINPLPGLSPEYADLVIMAEKNGTSYENLVMALLKGALSRYNCGKRAVL